MPKLFVDVEFLFFQVIPRILQYDALIHRTQEFRLFSVRERKKVSRPFLWCISQKENVFVGNPLAESAVKNADAPGIGITE